MRTTLALLCLCLSWAVAGQEISDTLENQVKTRLGEAAQKSWELGTRTQTLLEHDVPQYSVFYPVVPPPQSVPSNSSSGLDPVFSIAKTTVSALNLKNSSKAYNPMALMKDGPAADPASIGPAVLLANWTQQTGANYSAAAKNQIDYLYSNAVPKTSSGALSHRDSEVQLWSDFIYMVPPFLALYGITTGNSSWLGEAHNQIKLYRDVLRDTNQDNLWKHVQQGSAGVDDGHWTTGNGWACMGMLRVLATIKHSQYAGDFNDQQGDLVDWTKEILEGIYKHLDKTNIFANYPERAVNNGNFYDAAGTTLIAASTYRLATLADDHTHLPKAENIRKTLASQKNGGGWNHFDGDGWLTPVVDPHAFGDEGSKSAEGQAFVLMMQQSWREWVAAGSQGANAASPLKISVGGLWAALVVGLTMMIF